MDLKIWRKLKRNKQITFLFIFGSLIFITNILLIFPSNLSNNKNILNIIKKTVKNKTCDFYCSQQQNVLLKINQKFSSNFLSSSNINNINNFYVKYFVNKNEINFSSKIISNQICKHSRFLTNIKFDLEKLLQQKLKKN